MRCAVEECSAEEEVPVVPYAGGLRRSCIPCDANRDVAMMDDDAG